VRVAEIPGRPVRRPHGVAAYDRGRMSLVEARHGITAPVVALTFDDGPDEDLDYRGMFSGGKQVEDSQPPEASKVRSDVRRTCCVISGIVYENVLFFPVV